jgi:hypothetical protein
MMASGHILAKSMGSDATSTVGDPETPSDKETVGESNQPDFLNREKTNPIEPSLEKASTPSPSSKTS